MNIYDYAMQMEKDGEKYYRDLAKKAPHKGVSSILNMLADDEVKHFNILQAMKSGTPEPINKSVVATKVLEHSKNVFEKMQEEGVTFNVKGTEIDYYRQAMDVEEQSRDFYLDKAEESTSEVQKKIFVQLADEEKRHYFLLDNLIEFLSKPNTWLENAEFFHLDEY